MPTPGPCSHSSMAALRSASSIPAVLLRVLGFASASEKPNGEAERSARSIQASPGASRYLQPGIEASACRRHPEAQAGHAQSGLNRSLIVRFRPAMITVGIGLGRLGHRRIVVIVTAIGIRIARSEILAICVRIELRAIAGVFDNGLRQNGSCKTCRGNRGCADQREFHLGLLAGWCTGYVKSHLQFCD